MVSLCRENDFQKLSDEIDSKDIDLQMILDFPQLFNYEQAREDKSRLEKVMQSIEGFKHNVGAFHFWGQIGRNAHSGDMNAYFNQDVGMKKVFLENLRRLFRGQDREIYFVPEINSGGGLTREQCLQNIVNDLESVGFSFNS